MNTLSDYQSLTANTLCSLSSIRYHTALLPIQINNHCTYHPIFDLKQSQLDECLELFENSQLSHTQIYLLTVAYLKQSQLVIFQNPCQLAERTVAICAQNLNRLVEFTQLIAHINAASEILPQFVINHENANLYQLKNWLDCWQDELTAFRNGLAADRIRTKLQQKERALERLIKSPNIPPHKYAHILADWAAMAATFPGDIAEYWRNLIIACHDEDKIDDYSIADIEECIEHCLDNLDDFASGSIFSYNLFVVLNVGLERKHNRIPLSEQLFHILDDDSGSDNQAKQIKNSQELSLFNDLLANAPQIEPQRSEYSSQFEYFKAMQKWKIANKSHSAS